MTPSSLDSVLAGQGFDRPPVEALLAGEGMYVSDLKVDGCLDAAFARSWEAHGIVRSVDASSSRDVDRVVAAFSAADLPDLPLTPPPPLDLIPPAMERPSLARGRVRYVGEPVAVVVAEDRYVAEDAGEWIEMEIDPLPAATDPLVAASDETQLFDGHSNVVFERVSGTDRHEVDRTFDSAAVTIEVDIRNERVSPVPLEPRAIVVVPQGSGITVFCSHQAPHRLRGALMSAFSLHESEVRVIVPNVGGAFGQKSHTFPEYIVLAHLAQLLGRPIRWIEDRRESLIASTHGRGQTQSVRVAADRDGRLLGMDVTIDADVGAYPHTGAMVPLFTSLVMSGPYKFPCLAVRARAIVTNTCPTAPYRGAGRPEAAYAIDRAIDVLARKLSIDPAEIRLRNFIPSDALPYETPTGAAYDSGDYARAFRKALELANYEDARRRQADVEPGRRVGIGLCSYIERSGGQNGSTEYGEVEVLPEGDVVVRSGSMSTGQNHSVPMSRIVASVLDLDPARVTLQQGDTMQVRDGTGSFASRTMQVGGAAASEAAKGLLEMAEKRAAASLEVDEADLDYKGGHFKVRGAAATSVSLFDLARDDSLLSEHEAVARQAFPYGSYVAIVEIDEETGRVWVKRLVAVEDCGVVIDLDSAEDQVVGSIAQGIGQALYEGCVYDDQGQPLTASMMDYLLPTAMDVPTPELAHIETPNPFSPVGAKGIGEAGCIGVPPTIANAIADALQVRDDRMDPPFTPEKVWRLSAAAKP